MIHVTAILVLVATSIFFGYHRRKKQPMSPLPPGPKPWPIIGCVPELLRNRPAYRWLHDLVKQLNTDIACVQLGKVHTIIVTSPEIAKQFLKKHDAVFTSRPIDMAGYIMSNGYLTAAVSPMGEQWKKMRKVLIRDVLSLSRFRWQLDKRNDVADYFLAFLYRQCSNNEMGTLVNVRTISQHYSVSVLRNMIFSTRYLGKGREDGGPGVEEESHNAALFLVLFELYAFYVSDYLPWLRPFSLDGREKKVRDAIKIIQQYQDPIIDARIQKWRCSDQDKRIQPNPIEEDLLDVFILLKGEDGQPLLSNAEIKAQITELQLAVVDNPSNSVEFALSEMLNQPEMLRKAQDELNKVVGRDMLVQESHIPRLRYITACLRESFRLHPVTPFNLPHVSIADAIVADYFIPKGSHVLLSRLGLGRNPKVWKNPMKFDPERHLNEIDNQQVDLRENELRFVTFTIGRRGCIGGTLGTAITVMLFARLLQGFTWSMPPNMDKIDLAEDGESLLKRTPLYALAKPRLHSAMYPTM